MLAADPFEFAARAFEAPPQRWATPGELGQHLDPGTRQTPALQLIDRALVDVADGRCERLIISMPPQEGKPVTLDSVILMGDGSRKPLGEVQVGDDVITHKGRARAVAAVHEQGELPIVRITTHAGRTVAAALDHPFLTPGGWVNAGDLTVGDVLAAIREPNIPGQATLTPEAARLMGYFIGDGNTTVSNFNNRMVSNAAITCVDDIEWKDILACAEALGFTANERPATKRILLSAGVRPWLREHGMAGCNSRTKRVPAVVFTQPANIIAEFLGAYFACDGTTSRRGGARPDARCEYNSVSRELLADVQHLLLRLGIGSTLRSRSQVVKGVPYTSYRLHMRRQDDVSRFQTLVPVHHAKAQTIADWSPRRTFFDGPYIEDPIESITTGETAECRCLTVEEDHTFTVSDLVVHNSQRTSRRFPTWMLTRDPELRIAIASYEHRTARRWGRSIRDDITTHGAELGLSVSPLSSAADEWQLAGHGGGVYCVGIGGALTGRPVDVLIIDDPLKDREQADSLTFRDRVWDWWTDVALTRLAPGAPVVVILTRWHEDDLAGRLLAAEDGDQWTVINIPAEADHDPNDGGTDPLGRQPGEFMESARGRTRSDWLKKKIAVGSRTWASLYQGRPSPEAGDIFERGWWQEYGTPQWIARPDGSKWVPGDAELIQSWDMAFKDTDGADFVVGQVWMRRGVQAFLLDQVHARLSFVDTCQALRNLTARWPQAILKLVEDKANGTAVINALSQTVPGIVPEEPHGSKIARAAAVSPFVEAKNVWLPAPELAPWIAAFVEEAAAFPNAAHDDQVDAMSQALNRLLLAPLLVDNSEVFEDEEHDQYSISKY